MLPDDACGDLKRACVLEVIEKPRDTKSMIDRVIDLDTYCSLQ